MGQAFVPLYAETLYGSNLLFVVALNIDMLSGVLIPRIKVDSRVP